MDEQVAEGMDVPGRKELAAYLIAAANQGREPRAEYVALQPYLTTEEHDDLRSRLPSGVQGWGDKVARRMARDPVVPPATTKSPLELLDAYLKVYRSGPSGYEVRDAWRALVAHLEDAEVGDWFAVARETVPSPGVDVWRDRVAARMRGKQGPNVPWEDLYTRNLADRPLHNVPPCHACGHGVGYHDGRGCHHVATGMGREPTGLGCECRLVPTIPSEPYAEAYTRAEILCDLNRRQWAEIVELRARWVGPPEEYSVGMPPSEAFLGAADQEAIRKDFGAFETIPAPAAAAAEALREAIKAWGPTKIEVGPVVVNAEGARTIDLRFADEPVTTQLFESVDEVVKAYGHLNGESLRTRPECPACGQPREAHTPYMGENGVSGMDCPPPAASSRLDDLETTMKNVNRTTTRRIRELDQRLEEFGVGLNALADGLRDLPAAVSRLVSAALLQAARGEKP